MWGKRFQVVVTTHLNTKHLHCHFVINSVSFADGKRLKDKEKSWYYFRHIADEICLEHKLSIVEKPELHRSPAYLTMKDEAGMPTRYNNAKKAIDEAIAMSRNLRQFQYELGVMGYHSNFSPNRKYATVTPKGSEKPIRTYRLGEEYTKEKILERLIANRDNIVFKPFQPKTYIVRQYRLPTREHKIQKVGGLYGLYLWQLITTTPQNFKGGGIWAVIVNINGAVQAIGLALLVLFFVVGMVRTCGSFSDVKKPEHAVKLFIRFALAKAGITYGMELMLALFNIVQGTIGTIMTAAGFTSAQQTTLPQEMIDTIESCGFFESIPLWAVTLIGGLFITVMSFLLIMTVYGRFFKLYMYTALAPIPLSTFAGEPSQNVGKSFIKSYCAVCLEGAVIVLACIIFSLFASSPPVVDPNAAAVTQVWSYIGELLFNMLVLVGSVRMSDRIIREMMGL